MIPLSPKDAAQRLIELNKTILGQTFPQIRSADEEVVYENEDIPEDAWENDEMERGEC